MPVPHRHEGYPHRIDNHCQRSGISISTGRRGYGEGGSKRIIAFCLVPFSLLPAPFPLLYRPVVPAILLAVQGVIKRLRIRWPLYLLPANEVGVTNKVHKQSPAQKLATKREELDYWYLTLMEHPDDDIAHAEFCKSIKGLQRAKRGLAGIRVK